MPALFLAMDINSDSRYYGGSDVGNRGALDTASEAWTDQPAQMELVLPPLAGLILIRADA